jgi:hypothetical protein
VIRAKIDEIRANVGRAHTEAQRAPENLGSELGGGLQSDAGFAGFSPGNVDAAKQTGCVVRID